MRLKYKNRILYEGDNSISLETENKYLTDDLFVENTSNNTVTISYGEGNEVATVVKNEIKKLPTKGKWLENDLNFTASQILEYYFAKNMLINMTTGEDSIYQIIGRCAIYLEDGDSIELRFNPANLYYPKEFAILWINQDTNDIQQYYLAPRQTKYRVKFVDDFRNTWQGYKVRIFGYADDVETFTSENATEEVYQLNDNNIDISYPIILKITNEGFFYSKDNGISFDRYITTSAGSSHHINTILNQYKTNHSLSFAINNNTSIEQNCSYLINSLKLILGNSTSRNHNITYDCGDFTPTSLATTVQRGSSYAINLDTLATSNQFINDVQVLMADFDVTDKYVNHHTINIPMVIGDLNIAFAVFNEEDILRQNYSPNKASWSDHISADFASGDYIEAKIDLTNFDVTKGLLLSFGQNIDVFTSNNSGHRIHIYYTKSTGELRIQFINHNGNTLVNPTVTLPSDNIFIFRIDKEGFSVNGTYYHSSDASTDTGYGGRENNLLNMINNSRNYNDLYVGSVEGSNRSNAYYEYIKVVHINPDEQEET